MRRFMETHALTKLNLADSGTRGVTVSELVKDELWWTGLKFLLAFETTDQIAFWNFQI